MPHELLYPLLFDIERTTVTFSRKYPRLVDKDIGAVYNAYREFFVGLSQGRDLDDPYSTLHHRRHLIDKLWKVIVYRERRGADDFVPDGDLVIGGRVITSYGQMYALGFNELRKSVRLWSKRGGPKGYIKFVRERVDEILAHEPALQERAAHSDKPDKLQESLDEFAAHPTY